MTVRGVLLDTNVLSELMRPAPDDAVMEWFARQGEQPFWITAVTQAEILLGLDLLPTGKRRMRLETVAGQMFAEEFATTCLPFDARAARFYATVVAVRLRGGLTTTTEDAQIAGIALAHQLPLATRNVRDFALIDGLIVIDPWLS